MSNIPDQTGKVAVITGGNDGLGFESTKALAAAGAHVVMAARNIEKAEKARDELIAFDPEASIEIIPLDLADQSSVKSAAATVSSYHPAVDVLMNNAGIMATPESRTADGFEKQLGVNHFGHWTFTAELLPAILRADGARVVTVTSVARHQGSAIDPENVNLEGSYDAWQAYGRSKLANYHFAMGLHQKFTEAGVSAKSIAAHPGLSNTNLQATTVEHGGGGWLAGASHELAQRVGMSAAAGARSQIRAATDPSAASGDFYGPMFGATGPTIKLVQVPLGAKQSDIDTLWEVSARETGVPLNVAAIAAGLT